MYPQFFAPPARIYTERLHFWAFQSIPFIFHFVDLRIDDVNTAAHWLCSCQNSPKIEFQNFQIGNFSWKNHQFFFSSKILKTRINGSRLSKYELPTPPGGWDRSILVNRKPEISGFRISNVKKKKQICDGAKNENRDISTQSGCFWLILGQVAVLYSTRSPESLSSNGQL